MARGKNRNRGTANSRSRGKHKSGPVSTADPDPKALFGTACSLRRLDRQEEAVQQFREVLRLDADDRQFARYWLAASLFDLQRHDDLKQLLERYEEPTAIWRYAQALFAFGLGGDTDDARRLLAEASRLDAGFLDYLLGGSVVYADRRIHFGGDQHETTHSLAALFLPAWRATPGAVSWVRRVLRVPLGDSPAELPFPRRELCGLPVRNVRWQVGLRHLDQDEPELQIAVIVWASAWWSRTWRTTSWCWAMMLRAARLTCSSEIASIFLISSCMLSAAAANCDVIKRPSSSVRLLASVSECSTRSM